MLEMFSDLKKDMMDIKKDYPFASAKYFSFFSYSRHNNFKRYLDQPKFYKNLQFHDFEKIKNRSAEIVYIDRFLFIDLCKHRKIDTTQIEKWYIDFLKNKTQNSTEYFPNLKKDEKHTLEMYSRPAGKYYSHSLNTINFANALTLCPYDVYKFCVTELAWEHGAYKADIKNSLFFKNIENIPFLSYDHKNTEYLLSYLNLIKLFIEKYPLSNIQLELAKHYQKCVSQLIKKVYAINHKKWFYKENARKAEEKKMQVFSKSQLKTILRQGAKLFHPDKNPDGLELFKSFNKHYMNLDGYRMQKMIDDYLRTN